MSVQSSTEYSTQNAEDAGRGSGWYRPSDFQELRTGGGASRVTDAHNKVSHPNNPP
jgi:hypothetical protein